MENATIIGILLSAVCGLSAIVFGLTTKIVGLNARLKKNDADATVIAGRIAKLENEVAQAHKEKSDLSADFEKYKQQRRANLPKHATGIDDDIFT